MKTINYKFCDGTSSTVEVTEEFYGYYECLEKQDRNNERRETRRHTSLDYLRESGIEFPAQEDVYEVSPFDTVENEVLRKALENLLPCQKKLIIKIFFEGMKVTEVAKAEGVCKNAISMRLSRIYAKIKKDFERP